MRIQLAAVVFALSVFPAASIDRKDALTNLDISTRLLYIGEACKYAFRADQVKIKQLSDIALRRASGYFAYTKMIELGALRAQDYRNEFDIYGAVAWCSRQKAHTDLLGINILNFN